MLQTNAGGEPLLLSNVDFNYALRADQALLPRQVEDLCLASLELKHSLQLLY